jgi:hypothetical protein
MQSLRSEETHSDWNQENSYHLEYQDQDESPRLRGLPVVLVPL